MKKTMLTMFVVNVFSFDQSWAQPVLQTQAANVAQVQPAKSAQAKKPKGPRLPANVDRQNYGPEKFYETPPVTLLNLPAKPNQQVQSAGASKSAPEYSLKDVNLKDPSPVSAIPSGFTAVPAPLPVATIDRLELPEMKTIKDNLVTVDDYSKPEVQLFEGYFVLNELRKPLAAYGTFARLSLMKERFTDSARWGFAQAALELGLRVQYETILLELMERQIKDGKNPWLVKAFDDLVKNSDAEKSVWVHSMSDKYLTDSPSTKTSDAFYILRGLRFSAQKTLDLAMQDFNQVPVNSKLYGHRLHQEALALYRQGKLSLAYEVLREGFTKHPQSFEGNAVLKTKAALLWGRLAFQSREFKQAFEAYRSVPRNSPKWPEAMMEQALTQVLFKDYEGAAGNMFTLHTDFFKKSYAPESYLIRTVGYLNLCQFPDALRAVQDFQRKYKPIVDALDKYEKSLAEGSDYDIIREFAKNPGAPTIRGIARPFLFAWTQDAGFERHQERINQIEDELNAFQELSSQVVKKERELAQKIVELGQRSLMKGLEKSEVEKYQTQIENTKIEHRMLTDARKSLAALRGSYFDQMDELKSDRKKLAASSLASRRTTLKKSLQHMIDQSEVLLYEIYSGAGDQLRFEAAGGKIDPKNSEALKGLKENDMKWKFKGEIWEDELGHFRSSLSNVCGKDENPKKVSHNEVKEK